MMKIKLPTQDNIAAAISIYENLGGWKQSKRIISSYFGEHIQNVDETCVTIKTILINSLYFINIRAPIIVANHILQLPGIDAQLHNGDLKAVDSIANTRLGNLISFASKYAHFSNKGAYPLYDKHARASVSDCLYQKSPGPNNYDIFYSALNMIRTLASLDDMSWEDLDKYMWLRGISLAIANGEHKINSEVLALYNSSQGKQLFGNLEPKECVIDLP